jgi:hypothetical protein
MKYVCILLFALFSLFAWSAVDPAPDYVRFKLDSNIMKYGAYISLTESVPIKQFNTEDRIQIIKQETDFYYFRFPGNSLKITIIFRDSTEKYTSIINNEEYYSTYKISLNPDNNIVATDITNYLKNISLLKFIPFAVLCFLILKILPTWIIFSPKDTMKFLKYYGMAQLAYSILFAILTFLFHAKGLLISFMVILVFIVIDNRILNFLYGDSKNAGRISVSILLTVLLTIAFSVFQLFAYLILI